MKDKFASDRTALRGYASDVGNEAPHWNASANRLKEAHIDAEAFTSSGRRIATNYARLVREYSWYAWRIGVTLARVEDALNATAKNYGKNEAKIKNDINKIGEQF